MRSRDGASARGGNFSRRQRRDGPARMGARDVCRARAAGSAGGDRGRHDRARQSGARRTQRAPAFPHRDAAEVRARDGGQGGTARHGAREQTPRKRLAAVGRAAPGAYPPHGGAVAAFGAPPRRTHRGARPRQCGDRGRAHAPLHRGVSPDRPHRDATT